MSGLTEFQRSLATDILFGGAGSARYLRGGPVAPEAGIGVHRSSVAAALVNAIRLSCPTLTALVDANFLEQAVRDYARSRPPHTACLASFADGFARFLEMYPPARGFPFFGDVVRFDTAIDKTSRERPGAYRASIPLGPGVSCKLLASLRQVSTRYPVDRIRDEVEAGRIHELERLDMKPRIHHFALWPGTSGSSVKKLTDPAAAFLRALLDGHDGVDAVNDALHGRELDETLSAIRSEVLIAPLVIVSFDQTLGVTP